jgi:hypothetical protein
VLELDHLDKERLQEEASRVKADQLFSREQPAETNTYGAAD